MSKLTILKGWHRPWNKCPLPKLSVNKKVLSYKYIFTDSCKYDIGEDQSDINKLFGLSFSLSPHKNSIRVGWRYVPSSSNIELLSYIYKDGVRSWKPLCFVGLNEEVSIEMSRLGTIAKIEAKSESESSVILIDVNGLWGKFSYELGLYFGGNKTAPHNITIVKKATP